MRKIIPFLLVFSIFLLVNSIYTYMNIQNNKLESKTLEIIEIKQNLSEVENKIINSKEIIESLERDKSELYDQVLIERSKITIVYVTPTPTVTPTPEPTPTVTPKPTPTPKPTTTPSSKKYKVVNARITAYAPFDNQSGVCNDGDPSNTSTGQYPNRKLIAVDPSKIPYGTKVYIPSLDEWFEAGDTGSALRNYNGYAIDLFVKTYKEARNWGVRYLEVWIYN